MFDFVRNLTKSADQRQRETLNAYLDDALSAKERARFEARLAQEPALRAELNQLTRMKAGLRQLPRVRAPRNFTLDPAVYGAPQADHTGRLYLFMRTATVLTAFLFALTIGLALINQGEQSVAGLAQDQALSAPAQEVAATEEGDAVAMEALEAEDEPAPEIAEYAEESAAADAVEEETNGAGADAPTEPEAPAEAAPIRPATSAPLTMTTGTPTAPPMGTPAIIGMVPTIPAETNGESLRGLTAESVPGERATTTEADELATVPEVDEAAAEVPDDDVATLQTLATALAGLFLLLLVTTVILRRRLR